MGLEQAGRTDRTQYWTRWILEHRYTDQPGGLPGPCRGADNLYLFMRAAIFSDDASGRFPRPHPLKAHLGQATTTMAQ